MASGSQAWGSAITATFTANMSHQLGARRRQTTAECAFGAGDPAGTLAPTRAASPAGEREWVFVLADEALVVGSTAVRNTTESDEYDVILSDAAPVTSRSRCIGIAHFAIALASYGWIVRNGLAWGISDGTPDGTNAAAAYARFTNNGGAGSLAGTAATTTPEAQVGVILAQATIADNSLAGVHLDLS